VATSAALLLVGGTLFLLLTRTQRIQATEALNAQAAIYATYAAELAPTTTILEGVADRVARRFPPPPGTAVRIFATNGSLLTSDRSLGEFPSRAVQPLVVSQAPFLPLAPSLRLYVAQPIMRGNQRIGIVEVSSDLTPERHFRRQLLLALLPAWLLGLIGAFVLANLLARSLLRPLIALGSVAGTIAGGQLDARADDTRPDEIGELAAQINRMAADLKVRFEEVQRLAETRREFYRSVSHELRTPLTALRGMAENLEDSATPGQRKSVAIIQAETERLQRLVEELLAGGERAFIPLREKEPVDLEGLLMSVVDLMRPRAVRAGIDLRYEAETPGIISGDRDRLRQALVNVLDNALKWTPPGGTIRVSLVESNMGGRPGMAVTVVDSGPGIPDPIRENMWERGTHGPDGGQGLGLALVREVVEAHGGDVCLGQGPGTTIQIRFPRRESRIVPL
jgi:signal transduction histidine kinase